MGPGSHLALFEPGQVAFPHPAPRGFFWGEGGMLHSMWDLSSLTRDRTHTHPLRWKSAVLTTGLPAKFP